MVMTCRWYVCNRQVRYSVIENSESCININFENVAVAKLHDVRPRWVCCLRSAGLQWILWPPYGIG